MIYSCVIYFLYCEIIVILFCFFFRTLNFNYVFHLMRVSRKTKFKYFFRFAERIFWSIEAVRAQDEYSAKEILSIVNSPRSIELYIFLQSYVHSLPQVILQFYILIRHNTNIKHETGWFLTKFLIPFIYLY